MSSTESICRSAFYFLAGLPFLILAKGKNIARGYTTPRTSSWTDIDHSVEYDITVAQCLLKDMTRYGVSLEGRDVLELGPGSDLGVGYCVLAHGAKSYTGFDVNPLGTTTPPELYERLRQRLDASGTSWPTTQPQYVVRRDFDLRHAFKPDSFDIVFSQFAFEHFDEPLETIRQLPGVIRPGGVVIAQIDLKTHSRWIRDKDPLNIYRYPDWLYGMFHFSGQPNRVRPGKYRHVLSEDGWIGVQTFYGSRVEPIRYAKRFRNPENEMEYLTVTICAMRSG